MKIHPHIWQGLLVFLLATVQYSNTSRHGYAWDDAIVLTENKRVQKGLNDIPELFENIKTNETANRYGYRPISLLSFATDVHFFGMDPKASHKVSIFLYGVLCLVIFIFLNSLFPEYAMGNMLITMLFAVHPLHSEVVANIKSRDEVLAMLFGLLALLSFRRAQLVRKWYFYLLSLLLFILAFLSKESAITFIGVAVLMAWMTDKGTGLKSFLLNSSPALLMIVILLGIRMFVYSDMFFQSNDMLLYKKGMFHQDGFIGNPLFAADLAQKTATAVFLICYFLYRLIAPLPLLHDYSFNQFAIKEWSEPVVWVSVLVLLLLISATIYGLYKKNTLGFGLAFFFMTISIYLHLVQPAPDIFAERFVFVPSLGVGIAILSIFSMKLNKVVISVFICLLVVPMFGITWNRNKAWKNNDTLLETDLPHLTNCVRANYNYALLLHRKYYELPQSTRFEAKYEVLRYYEQTFALTDRLFNVYLDLGSAYMEFGYPEKGKLVFEKAIEKYPELSIPYVQMGKYYMSFKKWDEAIPYFEKALENGALNSDFHYLLAICQFNMERHDEAIATLLAGEKLGVSSSAYHSLIARLYVKLGQIENGKSALERGLKLYPNDLGLRSELINLRSSVTDN